MVAQVTFNHLVAGSSPVGGTKYPPVAQWLAQQPLKLRVVGSTPTGRTKVFGSGAEWGGSGLLSRSGYAEWVRFPPLPPELSEVIMYLRTIFSADMPVAADSELANQVLCGRITNVRRQGGVCFITIQDHTGRTQLFGQRNVLGDRYVEFCQMGVGDMVYALGNIARTVAGEPSLFVADFGIGGVAYDRPPLGQITSDGVRMNALEDVEERRRSRHLDMMSDPDTLSRFMSRSRFISDLRSYLSGAQYVEVETPILQEQATGATAATFNTYHNEMNQDMQLRIALEIHLKLCIMGGLDRVFEIGRVFRNEGVSSRHNPEFTLLEMYAAWTGLEHMMSETEHIVRMAYAAFGCELPEFRVATMGELVGDSDDVIGDFDNRIAHTLIEPTFVTNHPLSDSPFAQEDVASPGTAMRFELYINGVEVANAYQEINDAEVQAARLRQADGTLAPMDAYFVNAMRNGMPPTSGLGIGIDRLVMLASGATSIRDIVLFPSMRNTGGTTML